MRPKGTRKDTKTQTPAFFPKGTLCAFVQTSLVHSQSQNILSGHNRKTKREPPAIGCIMFDSDQIEYNHLYPDTRLENGVGYPYIVLPLAESTEVRWNHSEYVSFCIKDTTEIAVRRDNKSFTAIAGDRVYANVKDDFRLEISTEKESRLSFSLGIVLLPFVHIKGQRCVDVLTVTLNVERVLM